MGKDGRRETSEPEWPEAIISQKYGVVMVGFVEYLLWSMVSSIIFSTLSISLKRFSFVWVYGFSTNACANASKIRFFLLEIEQNHAKSVNNFTRAKAQSESRIEIERWKSNDVARTSNENWRPERLLPIFSYLIQLNTSRTTFQIVVNRIWKFAWNESRVQGRRPHLRLEYN